MTVATIGVGWSIDRASGVAALLIASVSILAGTLVSDPVRRRALRVFPSRDLQPLHEALSLAALVAIGVHVASFAIDGFFHAGLAGALVPFASPYRRVAIAAGQLAAYGLAAFSLTFYLRRRIGPARWRVAHRAVAVFWALAVVHALFSGSDVRHLWFLLAVLPPVGAAVVAIGQRWLDRGAATPGPARSAYEQPLR